ncbi:MAG TPA: rhomboid family intramembrane serine protease [Solirubrobacteraceae bacterium]|nr:rhomboid family intramembrane serine protease [Solirubrobacteraceae bacterium]
MTYAIIAVNVVVFLLMISQGGTGFQTRVGSIYENGVLFGPFVDQGDWWRLLTAGFMHDGATHLIFNMLGVFFLGQMLERELGPVRFAALYFASLFAGAFGALLLSPDAATVGASGAVFGLFGAAFVIMRQQGINPLRTIIGIVLVLNLLTTFQNADTISVGGHLGGLAGGGLCAMAIIVGQQRSSQAAALFGCIAIGVIAVIGGIAAAGTPSLY